MDWLVKFDAVSVAADVDHTATEQDGEGRDSD
jgi:hypothetical protein